MRVSVIVLTALIVIGLFGSGYYYVYLYTPASPSGPVVSVTLSVRWQPALYQGDWASIYIASNNTLREMAPISYMLVYAGNQSGFDTRNVYPTGLLVTIAVTLGQRGTVITKYNATVPMPTPLTSARTLICLQGNCQF